MRPDALLAHFPFHVRFDADLSIVALGASARKVLPGLQIPVSFFDVFQIVTPRGVVNLNDVLTRLDSTFLCVINGTEFRLRGQIIAIGEGGFAFIGSPWLEDPKVLREFNLKESDFAPHESSIEHLYITYSRNQQLNELNELNQKLQDTIQESQRLRDLEEVLTRDLQVAADLRLHIIRGRIDAVSVNASSIAELATVLTPGLALSECPAWLNSVVRDDVRSTDDSLVAVQVGSERRSLDLRMSQVSKDEYIVLGRDVSDERAEYLLLLQTLEQAMEAVIMVDQHRLITFFNRAARNLFQYSRREVLGRTIDFLSEDAPCEANWLYNSSDQRDHGEVSLAKQDGSRVLCRYSVSRVRLGKNEAIAAFLQDITLQREAEERISFEANHDGLTGLANRRYFQAQLHSMLAASGPANIAVVMIDMDDFKTINDLLGHAAGDTFLKITANRISNSIRESDFACRLGGDEFALILQGISSKDQADRIVTRMTSALCRPMTVDTVEWTPTASVGVAIGEDSVGSANMLRNADLAMYEAKALGKGRVHYFTESLSQRALGRIETKKRLEKGLRNGEIRAHFQPIVDLVTGAPVAFEALARWEPAEGPAIPPSEFIPVAEKSDLILDIEKEVLRLAIGTVRSLRENSPQFPNLWVNVNISSRHFAQPQLSPLIQSLLADYDVPADAVILELTESIFLNDSVAVQAHFDELRSIGVRIALDDFGTGYSSLSYLDRYPFDMVKIDRSFVHEIASADMRRRLVEIILAVGGAMDATVVAEGIERAEDEQVLCDMRCQLGQGFLYARPMPIEAIPAYLSAQQVAADCLSAAGDDRAIDLVRRA